MKQRVQLSITGLQTGADLSDSQQTVNKADYFQKENVHYLFYEEPQEGTRELQKCRIRFSPGKLEVTRQGMLSSHMIFEEHKKHMTQYRTPFGTLLLGIETRSVELLEEESHMTVRVEYALEMNGGHMSDSRIELRIEPEESGNGAGQGIRQNGRKAEIVPGRVSGRMGKKA